MSSAIARTRSAITLVVLAVVLIACVAWGWSALTKPFPSREPAPLCTDLTIPAGDNVYPEQVAVSVINASERNGLARETLNDLVDGGFVRGETGDDMNTEVRSAQIWTTEPGSAAVALVRSYLGKNIEVKRADASLPGINVLVGDGFKGVAAGKKSLPAKADTTVCGPPGA